MPSTKAQAKNGTVDEKDLEVIKSVMDKFDLNSAATTTEGKLNAVCLMFNDSIAENSKLKEEQRNMMEQLEKESYTREALQKLCVALRTQIGLVREECDLRLAEETQKRVACTDNFSATVNELSALVGTHTDNNRKLREENTVLTNNLKELLQQFEARDTKARGIITESQLQLKLYEAKMAKARIESAEKNADFTRERLEMHKAMLELREENEKLTGQLLQHMPEQGDKSDSVPNTAQPEPKNVHSFRKEMDKLGKKLRKIELDSSIWREKFEASNDQVKKMNTDSFEREKELEQVRRKLQAMENLNRALQKEREALKAKANGEASAAIR